MGQAKNRGTLEERVAEGIAKKQLELEEEERRWQEEQSRKQAIQRELGKKIVQAEDHIRTYFKDTAMQTKFPDLDDDFIFTKIHNFRCDVYIKSHKKSIVYKIEYDEDGDMRLTNLSKSKESMNLTTLAIMAGALGAGIMNGL